MFAALLQLSQVLLGVEESAFGWFLLEHTDRTLHGLNMYHKKGSCTQFTEHAIITCLIQSMAKPLAITAEPITSSAKGVVW